MFKSRFARRAAAGTALGIPLSVLAISVPLSGVRLQIDNITPAQPTGFFDTLRSRLGVRAPATAYPPGTTFTVHATAYAPSPHQTDNTPCITAAGTRVRQGTVAANFLPLGTILEIDGERYIVEDRKSRRHPDSIDVFFYHTSDAVDFGRQQVEVTIIGYGEPGQPLTNLAVNEDGTVTLKAPAAIMHALAPPNLTDRIRGRVIYLGRLAAELIGARSPEDLNRYDVDCLTESTPRPPDKGE